jgi:hypothetical protein
MTPIATIVTRQVPPSSPTLSITLTSNDPMSELVSSLSGDLDDYRLVSSAPGEITIAANYSYKERFQRTKAELSEVAERVKKLEEERDILEHAQVYSEILTGKSSRSL